MNKDLKNILSNLNPEIDQEKLLEYINRNLSDEARHAFEKQMAEDEFVNDAVEGLEQISKKKDIPGLTKQLNTGLKKQLEANKKRRSLRSKIKNDWIYFALVLLLVLIIVSYLVI